MVSLSLPTWQAPEPLLRPSLLSPINTSLTDDDEMRCGYSSKKCFNPRTTKKGGGLHRFCEFHRRRANSNQWRVDDKRRVLRAERRQQLKRLRAAVTTHDPLRCDPRDLLRSEIPLTQEELQLLHAILFDTDSADSDAKARTLTAQAPPSPSCVGEFIV